MRVNWIGGLVIFMLVSVGSVLGEATYWEHDPATAGQWSSDANWSDGVPTAAHTPYIGNGGTAEISQGEAFGNYAYIGHHAAGHVEHVGGTLTVSVELKVGAEGGEGSYTLHPGARLTTFSLSVGHSAPGTLTQIGGINSTEHLTVAQVRGSAGTLTIHDGEMHVANRLQLGYGGQGRIVQNGGRVVFGNGVTDVHLGWSGVGTYELNDGVLDNTHGYPRQITLGTHSRGYFIQSGGSVSVDVLWLGSNHGSYGEVRLSDGSMETNDIRVGRFGTGEFIQSGGSVLTGRFNVGYGDMYHGPGSGDSLYEISGGSLEADRLTVGYRELATLRVAGGAGQVSVGDYAQGAKGTLVSRIGPNGLTTIEAGGSADLAGNWTVEDTGAGFGRFDVLRSEGPLSEAFNLITLPPGDWDWGVDGRTLWVEHVPEPASAILVLTGLSAAVRRRRR